MESKDTSTTIRLGSTDLKRLLKLCKKHKRSKSNLLRIALDMLFNLIDDNPKWKPPAY